MNTKFLFSFTALVLTFLAITFSSCKKDEVETVPLETVNGDIFESVDYGSKVFLINFKTDLETYPVTFLIRSSSSVDGNKINIKLIDIEKDGHDDLNIARGSASCTINLGSLANGVYDLKVEVVKTANSGTLTITDGQIFVNFPSAQKLSINHDSLNRIPFGTVWGYVGYQSTSNQGLANNFISGMDAFGAEPTTLEPGYYGYFSISDSSEIIQAIDPNYPLYKEFIRDYHGEATALNEHIGYYNTEHYNKVDVYINWFWDGTKK